MQDVKMGYPVGFLVAEPGVCSVLVHILGIYGDSSTIFLVCFILLFMTCLALFVHHVFIIFWQK